MEAVTHILEFLRLYWIVLGGLCGTIFIYANMRRDIKDQDTAIKLLINKNTEQKLDYQSKIDEARREFDLELERIKAENRLALSKIEKVDELIFEKLDKVIQSVSDVQIVVGEIRGRMYARDSIK